MSCTVQDHVAELVTTARRAYAEGRRAGLIEGDEAGHIAGYTAGHHDGVRSSSAYKSGQAEGFITGYLERIGDELAQRGEVK